MRSTRPWRLSLKAQGNTRNTLRRAQMHAQRRAGACAITQTCTVHIWIRKQTHKNKTNQKKKKSRWIHCSAGTLKQTQTLAWHQKHSKLWTNTKTDLLVLSGTAIRNSHQTYMCGVRNKPCTESIFSLFCSHLIFSYPYVVEWLTSLSQRPTRQYNEKTTQMKWRRFKLERKQVAAGFNLILVIFRNSPAMQDFVWDQMIIDWLVQLSRQLFLDKWLIEASAKRIGVACERKFKIDAL